MSATSAPASASQQQLAALNTLVAQQKTTLSQAQRTQQLQRIEAIELLSVQKDVRTQRRIEQVRFYGLIAFLLGILVFMLVQYVSLRVRYAEFLAFVDKARAANQYTATSGFKIVYAFEHPHFFAGQFGNGSQFPAAALTAFYNPVFSDDFRNAQPTGKYLGEMYALSVRGLQSQTGAPSAITLICDTLGRDFRVSECANTRICTGPAVNTPWGQYVGSSLALGAAGAGVAVGGGPLAAAAGFAVGALAGVVESTVSYFTARHPC